MTGTHPHTENPEAIERLEIYIEGRVQGVGFRHFVSQQARRLGIEGWVRNESDGTVRVVAEGPKESLEQLLSRVKEGPSTARVDNVKPQWSSAERDVSGFTVRYF